MSVSQATVTYETNECSKKLLVYANEQRREGMFNDISVKAGSQLIQANRMILSCFSKFFEKLFRSRMKEQYQDTIEVKEFDGEAVEMLIDFMYERKISIKQSNVIKLLAASDFLQLDEVKESCFDYLQREMGVDSCMDVLAASMLYKPQSSLDNVYLFIGENLDYVVESEQFKNLSKSELVSLIKNLNNAEQSSIFEAVKMWVKFDEERRKEDFSSLFQLIDLHRLPFEYLENVVATDELVKENNDCLNAVVSQVFKKLKEPSLKENGSKILCLGGRGDDDEQKVIEVYNISGTPKTLYPDLPVSRAYHCVVNINNVVYCIGGWISRQKVYRLNLNKQTLKWEEVCPMNEARHYYGAAAFKNSIVVSGGYPNIDSAEVYEFSANKWKTMSSMNRVRSGHALVECNGYLYALGGNPINKAPTVERLSELDGEWEAATPMQTPRDNFAAVNCGGYIHAIGGQDEQNKAMKKVEKFDSNENKWSYVSDMNIARKGLSACVLHGRIFVIGGVNENNEMVDSIECYDPMTGGWSFVVNVTHTARNHALVVV